MLFVSPLQPIPCGRVRCLASCVHSDGMLDVQLDQHSSACANKVLHVIHTSCLQAGLIATVRTSIVYASCQGVVNV